MNWHAALLGLGTLLLYAFGLSWAPVHLHFDEIKFAEQARSIAATLTDVNGRFLPVYFQMDNTVWFHPIGVYLPAAAFKLWGVSTVALRMPTAIVGVLNVLLTYFIAKRIFHSSLLGVVAGVLLALAPAHFMYSRMAVDYLFPVPFALGWLLLLLAALERKSPALLFAAASLLGAGCYSYIAALVLMPLLLVVTLVLLWLEDWPPAKIAIAVVAFAWPLIPAAWFISSHPEVTASTLGRYGIAAGQLDAFQRARDLLTPWSISDRANLYASFFSPGYLFVTGGGSLVGSTRAAGVLLIATLPLILIGFRGALVRYSPSAVLLLAGLFLPPIAASLVPEEFAIGRAMTMVPFAVLLAVKGIADLLETAPSRRLTSLMFAAGIFTAGLGLLYLVYRTRSGELSAGGVVLVCAGLAMCGLGSAMRRTGQCWPLAAALVLVCVLQFSSFARDYFGDYRARSAPWFNGNVKGAIARVVELDPSGSREVLLAQDIAAVDWYWRFHLAEMGRSDLAARARVVSRQQLETDALPEGTMLIAPASDTSLRALAENRAMALTAVVSEPGDDPPREPPAYFIFVRR